MGHIVQVRVLLVLETGKCMAAVDKLLARATVVLLQGIDVVDRESLVVEVPHNILVME